MKQRELPDLFVTATLQGVANALAETGFLSGHITKAQAYRIYGRSDVDRWISEGLLSLVRVQGQVSKKCIDRIQLDRIAASSNRISYLPVAERNN